MPGPRIAPLVIVGALAAASVMAAALAGCSQRGGLAEVDERPTSVEPQEDFARPDDTAAAVRAAGLVLLGSEQLAVHYHARLRVEVDGRAVDVPAYIGIGTEGLSELHTHDTTGIIHIESAEDVPFTLGQFMTEWDVGLTPTCLGDFCADADHALTVTVDDEPYRGNPAEIVFENFMEITISYGPRG